MLKLPTLENGPKWTSMAKMPDTIALCLSRCNSLEVNHLHMASWFPLDPDPISSIIQPFIKFIQLPNCAVFSGTILPFLAEYTTILNLLVLISWSLSMLIALSFKTFNLLMSRRDVGHFPVGLTGFTAYSKFLFIR